VRRGRVDADEPHGNEVSPFETDRSVWCPSDETLLVGVWHASEGVGEAEVATELFGDDLLVRWPRRLFVDLRMPPETIDYA
jgi:hypothetical protein